MTKLDALFVKSERLLLKLGSLSRGWPAKIRKGLADGREPTAESGILEFRNWKLGKLRIAQLLLIAALAVVFMGADSDARFNSLGHQLMCMCSCNQILLECNHVGCQYSTRMRDELTAGIARGDNDSLILQSFVQKYGSVVLAAPTTSGFNRIAWIMPFAVFVLACALTVWLVRMWKSRALAQPVATPKLGAGELDELRKKARQETEF